MYRHEKEVESCINMVNIFLYIFLWIFFIECIIELHKNSDNLFFPIFSIIICIFLICCISMSLFYKYLLNMKCTIFNKQNNDVHGDIQENDENLPRENSKLIQIIQIFINKIKKFIKWNNIQQEEIQQEENNELPVAVLELGSGNNELTVADEVYVQAPAQSPLEIV